MNDLWEALGRHAEAFKGVYWPSNFKELADVFFLVVEAGLQCSLDIRDHLNTRLAVHEPVFLVGATAFFFISLWWIRGLLTYDGFVPTNKRPGLLEKLRKLPIIRGLVEKRLALIVRDMELDLKKDFVGHPFRLTIPERPVDGSAIIQEVKAYNSLSGINWKGGRVSGAIYSRNDISFEQMILQVYQMTLKSNHLHADVFSGVRKMEAEIIRWVINLFSGDANASGSISSGGTESIVLACKAYRDYALNVHGISRPEMVVPVTAHAAFDKAAEWLRMEIRKIPLDPKTLKVNLTKMRRAINKNTVMIVGSAPNYPHGIIDPIEAIADMGYNRGIPVHVDCCLGGFLLPFMKDAGFDVEPFDFRLKGVTSISVDTHKYAMAPKGTSVVMYSDKKYHHEQFSVAVDWPGGLYVTPTISGSRSGAVVACCWASIRYHGREGYVKACKEIIKEAMEIKEGVRGIEGLKLLGEPMASVVAFTSDQVNIFEVNSAMGKLGWHLNPLQFPSAIHFCLTTIHAANHVAPAFIEDLKKVMKEMMKSPKKKASGQAAVYGLAQTIPDRSLVKEILHAYMDTVYSTTDLKPADNQSK